MLKQKSSWLYKKPWLLRLAVGCRLLDDLSGAGGCLPCRPLPTQEACEWVDWCRGQAYRSLDQGLPDTSDKKIGSEKIPASISPDLSQKCHSWVSIYESALTQNRQGSSQVVHCPPASTGDVGSIPGQGTSKIPWRRKRQPNPLQCSCLENPLDRGAWWATVHGGLQSRT